MTQQKGKRWPAISRNTAGARQVFDLTMNLVHIFCAMGVPEMELITPRRETRLMPNFERLAPERTTQYQQLKNRRRLDGRPKNIL